MFVPQIESNFVGPELTCFKGFSFGLTSCRFRGWVEGLVLIVLHLFLVSPRVSLYSEYGPPIQAMLT